MFQSCGGFGRLLKIHYHMECCVQISKFVMILIGRLQFEERNILYSCC